MILLTLARIASAQDVLINEVLYDSTESSDGAGEWIELCNPTSDTVDISGWEIQSAGTSWSESYTFDDKTTIAPGEYLAIGPGVKVGDFSPDLQNGGGTDGVRLVNSSGTVIDTVLYDEENGNLLEDDLGNTDGPFAPDVSAGWSIARGVDCSDVSNDGSDFYAEEYPTPGAMNNGAPQPVDCTLADGALVVINEFLADPPGSDSDDTHWVELLNIGTAEADLSGWMLLGGTSPGGDLGGAFPSGTTIPAGGYLIIGGSLVADMIGGEPDVVLGFSLGNASNADGIMLADCDEVVHDIVIYGTAINDSDEWPTCDGLDLADKSDLPGKPGSGETMGRLPDGVDTDDCAADIAVMDFPTPWSANGVAGECVGAGDIKINEFLPNPDSDDTSADDGREWVELYNNGTDAVDLTGWSLGWGTSSYGDSFSIPAGTTIEAGGYLLLGGIYVEGADIVLDKSEDFSMGASSSNADAVQLMHCGPGVADTVIYGDDNEDGWIDDTGSKATSFAPKAVAGESLARRTDGLDTDDSGVDFVSTAAITPGSANPEIACEAGGFLVKINEFSSNPADGTGHEWVELYNTGSVAIALDDWSIEGGTSSWGLKYTFPPGSSIGPGEFIVVGDEGVPAEGRDYTTDKDLSLGNASTGLDGIRLVDCPGDVQDTILYGDEDATPEVTDTTSEDYWEVDDLGTQTFAIFPSEDDQTIGRFPDGADTDDNGVDFCRDMSPTPGLPNTDCATSDGGSGNTTHPSKGCGKTSDGDPGKCSTGAGLAGPLWLIGAMVALRRRRRS
jgi:hypothetical protein